MCLLCTAQAQPVWPTTANPWHSMCSTSLTPRRGPATGTGACCRCRGTFRTTLRKSEGSTLAAKFGGNWTLQDEELVDGGVFFVSGCKEFLYREIPDNECPHVLVPVSLLRWTHSDIEQHLYFRHAMLIMRRRFIDVRRCTRVAGALRALEGNCWWPPRENALQFPPRLTRDRHCGIQRCTRM